ncbi:glycosyltransferase [Sphingomonas aurantiaca]|uniref:glycosyltransferase n=1 Tax=Sphingomonas aurantiaca TaxID=185949 RepID=UPI0018FE7DCE|nr:glycosyltransferase [Sphingomonas aurantiaca]
MDADVRIAIDGFNLAMPHGTGVATYGRALGDAITGLGARLDGVFGIPVGANPDLREILFYEAMGRGIPDDPGLPAVRAVRQWFARYRRAKVFDVPTRGLIVQDMLERRLPQFDRIMSSARLFERADRYFVRTGRFLTIRVANPPDIMHWTYPVPIRMLGTRNVYTLHDLVPLKLPYATLDRKRLYYRMIQAIVRDADHVCTVSESSRGDVIAQFGIAGDRITNTYQSVSTTQPRDDRLGDITAVFGLKPKGYFLYYGAIEPKKNVGRLIEAYLGSQVAAQSAKLAGGGNAIAAGLGDYERLRMQQEFLSKRYDAASAAFEAARQQAVRQQLYVVRIVDANMPVRSEYPKRALSLLTLFIALMVLYGLGWLVAAGVREHAS